MGSIGALCSALGARKNSAGRRIIIIKNNDYEKKQMGYEQPRPMTLFSYMNSRLPLGALPTSISKEAYPWPLTVVCHRRLASFTEAR